MAELSLKTHAYRKIAGDRSVAHLAQPYLQLKEGNQTVFLQKGRIFGKDKKEIPLEKAPAWVKGAMKKCDPDALYAVGFKVKEHKPKQEKVTELDLSDQETAGKKKPGPKPGNGKGGKKAQAETATETEGDGAEDSRTGTQEDSGEGSETQE
jgi:hypothetical protein